LPNFIDLLLLALVALSVAHGWRRGFLYGLLDLARAVGGLLFGLRFYHVAARLLAHVAFWPEVWTKPVAFLLTAGVAGLLIHLGGTALLRRVPKDERVARANRALGVVPGAASGLVSAAVAASLMFAVPLPAFLRESARESPSANRLAALTERLESRLSPIFDEAIAETLNRLTVRPESDERVELPFRVEGTQPRPELEARMLEMVNRERADAGLAPLAADPELTEVARRHSADMFARGYFSHVTPEGRSPFDRMHAANVTYLTAGENLALAPTLQIAHTGLMNSPGHRANILRPEFGRVGIGITDGGMRGLMVTQNFRN
jgi:uncharacterized protein YkwD